ncbi:MAG: DUF3108 domain-containing protein [Pseudomonadota bacterium]
MTSFLVQRTLGILALVAIASAPVADHAEAADELDLYMVMTMAGVTAGSIKLSVDEQESETISKLSMKSQGLFKFLTGYKSRAVAHSSNGVDSSPAMPLRYESTYEAKSGERRVEIRYDDQTGDIGSLGSWKRGKPRKTKVSAALQAGTVDPLTAMVRFRHWIRELRGDVGLQRIGHVETVSKTQVFDVFDGRRRYRLSIDLLERLEASPTGFSVPALRFRVELETLAGFGKNDMLANWSSEDGQRWIDVVVSDENSPIPISMSTIGGGLKTDIQTRKICRGEDHCRKVSH